jgi:hypothetical protein
MFQSSLEYFLPQQLGWRHESFDGFWFADARKTGTGTAEFAGLAILITSQKWTPIHLRIGLAPETDRVRTLDCRVGERCGARPGVVRIKYRSPAAPSYLEALPARIGQVAWMWRATRKPGLRRPIRRRGSPRCV